MSDFITYIPMNTIASDISLGFISVFVAAAVALALYLVGTMLWKDYKYRKFSLPISEEYITSDKGKVKKIVNPVEDSKFNISKKTGNEFIDEARQTANEMHRKLQEKEERKAKLEAKKLKKQLAKNKE